MKGLLCFLLQDKDRVDCSAGGISSRVKSVILVGPGIPEVFDSDEKTPAVVVRERVVFGKRYYRAVEAAKADDAAEMFGGCWVYTSDSRFPFDYPIPLHDRFE